MSPHALFWLAVGAAALVFWDARRRRCRAPLGWGLAVLFCSAPALLAYGWTLWRHRRPGGSRLAWPRFRPGAAAPATAPRRWR